MVGYISRIFSNAVIPCKTYLLLDGLKLGNVISKENNTNESDVLLADLPPRSPGYLYDYGSNRERFLYFLKVRDIFF